MKTIIAWIVAVVLANLTITWFGPAVSIINAFLLIGLTLTTRDALHERWRGSLRLKMSVLIACGGVISFIIQRDAGQIAVASMVAFLASGLVDSLLYQFCIRRSRFVKINISNTGAAFVDSLAFPLLAFGPEPWIIGIIAGQFIAKTSGGFLWSLVLRNK